jgi:hypothetical protein
MNLNSLTATQKKAYTKTTDKIRSLLGSYHSIALRIFMNCDREITGETVRNWFVTRTVPADMAFVLYEVCEGDIDPLTLVPWLAEYVELKAARREL